jgi:hypothetical protein
MAVLGLLDYEAEGIVILKISETTLITQHNIPEDLILQ